jgi:hypothetical protein
MGGSRVNHKAGAVIGYGRTGSHLAYQGPSYLGFVAYRDFDPMQNMYLLGAGILQESEDILRVAMESQHSTMKVRLVRHGMAGIRLGVEYALGELEIKPSTMAEGQ